MNKDDTRMTDVLIIDDDEQVCRFLSKIFKGMGYDVSYELTLKQGLSKIFSDSVDILFLDVHLPDGNGLEAIDMIRQHPFAPEIIIITGDENVNGAEIAMKSRAWDYISKVGSSKNFRFALERAVEYRRQKKSRRQKVPISRNGIIGESSVIQKCLDQVAKAADSDIPVLITGETGTGKELFSKAIHANSKRSVAEFVVVDCAALPERLVESTVFGHTKGAFTGADMEKTGLMKMADKGTLFLDEVGELPFDVQKKFLRALQEKKFRPLGSKMEVNSDFRLICATHRDLEGMVKEKKFREDLFFRIMSMNIHLPPLKERGKDVAVLAMRHMNRQDGFFPKNNCIMSRAFLEELHIYDWPGNVRELHNTLDLVCAEAGEGATLFPHHLPEYIRAFNIRHKFKSRGSDTPAPEKSALSSLGSLETMPSLKDHIENTKALYLQHLTSLTRGNIKESCSISGLSRGHLYRLMQQYHIKTNADS